MTDQPIFDENTPISVLDSEQILQLLRTWDDQERFFDMVNLVDALQDSQKTIDIIHEQACACNNLYWQNPNDNTYPYLERATALLTSITDELKHTPAWHYNLGFAYFYLGQIDNAKYHFGLLKDHRNEAEFLRWIDRCEHYHISPTDAIQGGIGGIQYDLLDFVKALQTHAPKLFDNFNTPATHQEVNEFEQKFGTPLPDNVRQWYRTFNGQKISANFADLEGYQHFLGLEEALVVQNAYVGRLIRHFGQDWQQLKPIVHDTRIIPVMYHLQWLPLCLTVNPDNDDIISLTCIDLSEHDHTGQLITLVFDEQIEQYEIYWDYPHLNALINELTQMVNDQFLVYDVAQKQLLADYQAKPLTLPSQTGYHALESHALMYYIRRVFGTVARTLTTADDIEICVINPTDESPYYTLITKGMGAHAMSAPDQLTPKHAELLIRLPPDWQIDSLHPKYHWVVYYLSRLAQLPKQQSYLASGQIVPIDPIDQMPFNSLLLIEADDEDSIAIANLPTGKSVVFYTLVPLYPQEMRYRLNHGNIALMQALEEANIPYPPVVDVHRANACHHYRTDSTYDLNVFDNVFWRFDERVFEDVMSFFEALKSYNAQLSNDLDFEALTTPIFRQPKAFVLYQAPIDDRQQLGDHEHFNNPDEFLDNGMQTMDFTLTINSPSNHINALILLWQLHQALSTKPLNDLVFFEGFYAVGKIHDDGEDWAVIEAKLGN